MTRRRSVLFFLGAVCASAAASVSCGSTPAPAATAPTPVTQAPTSLAVPVPSAPGADEQTTSLRPTLTVTNSTTTGLSGARTYEFQISDTSDFSAGTGSGSAYYAFSASQAGIAEGTGSTTFTPSADLMPAARLYWRARATQGSLTSDWSPARSLRTQIIGYNKTGEVYDPMVNGQSVAELFFKRARFQAGRGILIPDSDSYVRYRVNPPITGGGEFSVDIEGLTDKPVSDNPDTAKLKIFSMADTLFSEYFSKWMMNTQYRGFNGNPDNAISYKVLFGQDEDDHKLEPDLNQRGSGVRHLNPLNTYLWKATFGLGFRLQVFDGGTSMTGVGGSQIYDMSQTISIMYAPSPMYAYLGINESGAETGSFPNAIYRNLWIGDKPRPRALGSALAPAPAVATALKARR